MARLISLAKAETRLSQKLKREFNNDLAKAAIAVGVTYQMMYAVSHWKRPIRGKIAEWLGLMPVDAFLERPKQGKIQ